MQASAPPLPKQPVPRLDVEEHRQKFIKSKKGRRVPEAPDYHEPRQPEGAEHVKIKHWSKLTAGVRWNPIRKQFKVGDAAATQPNLNVWELTVDLDIGLDWRVAWRQCDLVKVDLLSLYIYVLFEDDTPLWVVAQSVIYIDYMRLVFVQLETSANYNISWLFYIIMNVNHVCDMDWPWVPPWHWVCCSS